MFSGIVNVLVEPEVSEIFQFVITTASEPLLKSSINSASSEEEPLGSGKTSFITTSAAYTLTGKKNKKRNKSKQILLNIDQYYHKELIGLIGINMQVPSYKTVVMLNFGEC